LIRLRRHRWKYCITTTRRVHDIDAVRAEVREARRVFAERRWLVIDVTRRSIEETAASIMKLLARKHGLDG
jgi:regulator of PEP synthase PpsR (kinase-PPPase family)